jgi:hypothetical protein
MIGAIPLIGVAIEMMAWQRWHGVVRPWDRTTREPSLWYGIVATKYRGVSGNGTENWNKGRYARSSVSSGSRSGRTCPCRPEGSPEEVSV